MKKNSLTESEIREKAATLIETTFGTPAKMIEFFTDTMQSFIGAKKRYQDEHFTCVQFINLVAVPWTAGPLAGVFADMANSDFIEVSQPTAIHDLVISVTEVLNREKRSGELDVSEYQIRMKMISGLLELSTLKEDMNFMAEPIRA